MFRRRNDPLAATPHNLGTSPRNAVGGRPSTPALRSYLSSITALDEESQETLEKLLQATVELRRSTSNVRRIQRGSPGARALGSTLVAFSPKINEISEKLTLIFQRYEQFPGMHLVKSQFSLFKEVLNRNFNDGGNEPGYSERVRLLEELMYITGMLRGRLEAVLEQYSYWSAKLAGENPPQIVRQLDFDQDMDPIRAIQPVLTLGNQTQLATFAKLVNSSLTANAETVKAETTTSPAGKTFKVSVNLPEEVQTALAMLWEEHKYTDIVFLVGDDRVLAHRAILAAQSEYFERMLFGDLREASMDEIWLQDVPVEPLRKVLKFAYSGSLHMKGCALQAILDIVSVADRFGFLMLKAALGDQLSHHISIDTVLLLLVHSDTYHLPDLHHRCLSFIETQPNTSKILESPSFLNLPENILLKIISRDTFVLPEVAIFRAVVQWKEHNEKSEKEMVKVLQHVRLCEFSPQEIFNEVEATNLFSKERILTAVRMQFKPSITDTLPRGKKETNQNLFTNPKVVFDSTAPPPLHNPWQLMGGSSPLQPCVADTVIQLNCGSSSQPQVGGHRVQRGRGLTRGPEQLNSSHTIIALDDLYIINYLHLTGYPASSDKEQEKKSFSYAVKISRDKSNWLDLFDYSSFACRGAQHLTFPKQAARYIRVDLTGKQDAGVIPLQLSACCYEEEQKPFKFLLKGVIAPQYELSLFTIPSSSTTENQQQLCLAYFRQPYSVSVIKFQLECSDPNVVEVDITVSGGVTSNLKQRELFQDFDRVPLKSPVVVETKERVVGYVAVTIKKLYKKPRPQKEAVLVGQTAATTASGQRKENKPLVSKHTGGVVKEPKEPVVKKELVSGGIPQAQQQTQGISTLLPATPLFQGLKAPLSAVNQAYGAKVPLSAANQAQGAKVPLSAANQAQGSNALLPAANQAQGAKIPLSAANQAQGANVLLPAANQAQGANAVLPATNQAQGANVLLPAANQFQGTGTLLPTASSTNTGSIFASQQSPVTFNFSTSPTYSGSTCIGVAQLQFGTMPFQLPQQVQPSTSTPTVSQQMQPGTGTVSLHIEEPVFTIVNVVCRSAL